MHGQCSHRVYRTFLNFLKNRKMNFMTRQHQTNQKFLFSSLKQMIPMDTIKTRLVAQTGAKIITGVPYKGIVDCAVRIAQEEGIKTFYRGLAPRLISVVPMIGIQFGVYEAMKRVMLQRDITKAPPAAHSWKVLEMTDRYGPEEAMEEAAMEVAADGSNTFPAPHFLKKLPKQSKKKPLFGIRFQ
jgi:hypothetical protein